MIITLNVFCCKDNSQINAQDLGISINLEDCVLVEHTFYNIDYIVPYRENDNYCLLSSGAEDFIIDEPYEIVKLKIEQISILRFN